MTRRYGTEPNKGEVIKMCRTLVVVRQVHQVFAARNVKLALGVVKLFTSRAKQAKGGRQRVDRFGSMRVQCDGWRLGDVHGGAGTAGLFRPRVLGPGLFVTSSDLFLRRQAAALFTGCPGELFIRLVPAHANDITLACNVPIVHVLQNCSPQG